MGKSNHLTWPRPAAVLFALLLCLGGCSQPLQIRDLADAVPGNMQTQKYLPLLAGKRVAVLTNASGMVGAASLVDTLLRLNADIKKVFVPEHGFRGEADAGVKVKSTTDPRTGLPIVSLYGKNKKPSTAQLADVDVVVYDIQDLGVRFYTYISTMSYMMEACAAANKKMVVLDRPNPNGFYVDGPVLEAGKKSFLGLHPVPLVYGMTCGEYAQMVNGEGWLAGGARCDLTVIGMTNYERDCSYRLPVKPSPNIPNWQSVLLYPGLGLFEGTVMGLGRGTEFPFQVFGHPEYPDTGFCFTPQPNDVNKAPRYAGETCCGLDLRNDPYLTGHPRQIGLKWLLLAYQKMESASFFEKTFDHHAGTGKLREQIAAGLSESDIRKSWHEPLENFLATRSKYLLYADFRK